MEVVLLKILCAYFGTRFDLRSRHLTARVRLHATGRANKVSRKNLERFVQEIGYAPTAAAGVSAAGDFFFENIGSTCQINTRLPSLTSSVLDGLYLSAVDARNKP